jgi:hypothetical protein
LCYRFGKITLRKTMLRISSLGNDNVQAAVI